MLGKIKPELRVADIEAVCQVIIKRGTVLRVPSSQLLAMQVAGTEMKFVQLLAREPGFAGEAATELLLRSELPYFTSDLCVCVI